MTGSLRTVLGLLCVAALFSLPTLQAGTAGQTTMLAIAPDQQAPVAVEQVVEPAQPQFAREAEGGRGGVTREATTPSVSLTPASTSTIALTLAGPADNGGWLWPTPSRLVTSPFGYRSDPFTGGGAFHSGVDFGDRCGTRVGATRPGTVTYAGWMGGYGMRVEVDHGSGIRSTYNHLEAITVRVGDQVDQTRVLGLVGTTGRSTGCHLHFEITINGGYTDPMPYLRGNPAADPTVFGSAPVGPETPSSSSESPSATESDDPCAVAEDPQEAIDTGGMIPISPTPSPSASESPCPTPTPTPTPSAPESSPTPDPSDETPTTSAPPPSTDEPSTPAAPETSTPAPSDSETPDPETSAPETSTESPTPSAPSTELPDPSVEQTSLPEPVTESSVEPTEVTSSTVTPEQAEAVEAIESAA